MAVPAIKNFIAAWGLNAAPTTIMLTSEDNTTLGSVKNKEARLKAK